MKNFMRISMMIWGSIVFIFIISRHIFVSTIQLLWMMRLSWFFVCTNSWMWLHLWSAKGIFSKNFYEDLTMSQRSIMHSSTIFLLHIVTFTSQLLGITWLFFCVLTHGFWCLGAPKIIFRILFLWEPPMSWVSITYSPTILRHISHL